MAIMLQLVDTDRGHAVLYSQTMTRRDAAKRFSSAKVGYFLSSRVAVNSVLTANGQTGEDIRDHQMTCSVVELDSENR